MLISMNKKSNKTNELTRLINSMTHIKDPDNPWLKVPCKVVQPKRELPSRWNYIKH